MVFRVNFHLKYMIEFLKTSSYISDLFIADRKSPFIRKIRNEFTPNNGTYPVCIPNNLCPSHLSQKVINIHLRILIYIVSHVTLILTIWNEM